MTRLDRYLDEVCRGVGGPRALRQHLREELREHILDAAAEYQSSGLTEEEALDRALEDFGGAAEVRGELEATHGHRVMAVLIDKALQWKEHTMRAKWLWVTFAHLALAVLVAVEVAFVWTVVLFILPRFRQMQVDGLIGGAGPDAEAVVPWGTGFLDGLVTACRHVWWAWVPLLAAWVLFEWRVRSENKAYMRLSALATAGLGMTLVVVLTAAALVLPLSLSMPHVHARAPEPLVRDAVAGIDAATADLNRAAPGKDWEAMSDHARAASRRLGELSRMGAAAPALLASSDQARLDLIRSQIRSSQQSMREAQEAIWERDAVRFGAALEAFEASYGAMRQATTRPAR